MRKNRNIDYISPLPNLIDVNWLYISRKITKNKKSALNKWVEKINDWIRPSAHSFRLREHKFFKKGQLQGRLKKLSLEQDPGHNTR